MAHYIDGFVLPISRDRLDEYRRLVEATADIWKEHGALAYFEYVGEDVATMEGTRGFPELLDAQADDAVIFGWVVFASRETRDRALRPHSVFFVYAALGKLLG